MNFNADTMFPGDLYDAASRFATDAMQRFVQRPGSAEDSAEARQQTWRQALAMGWTALLVDEARGGAGGSLADLGAVIEACARQAIGLPLVRRCAIVPAMLMAAGSDAASAVLRALGASDMDIDTADGSGLKIVPQPGGGVRVEGELRQLDLGLPFTHCLVAVNERLLLLPAEALPPPTTRYAAIDGSRFANLNIVDLHLPSTAQLQSGPAASAAAQAATDLAALATAIEIAATLGSEIEHCIEHLSTRVQFGVALASFQVLRHKVVDLYVQYESASVLLSRLVHDTVASGKLASRDAALVKLYLNDLARRSAEAAIQLHGGMGMTAELPAARLACRLLCAEFEHGDRLQQLAQLRRAGQPTPAPAH